jgi:hypothetical protein
MNDAEKGKEKGDKEFEGFGRIIMKVKDESDM